MMAEVENIENTLPMEVDKNFDKNIIETLVHHHFEFFAHAMRGVATFAPNRVRIG